MDLQSFHSKTFTGRQSTIGVSFSVCTWYKACSFCYVEKFTEVLVREPARVSHLVDFNMLYVCRCWDFNKHFQCPTTVYLDDRDCVYYEQKPPSDHIQYKRKQQSLKSMIESVYVLCPNSDSQPSNPMVSITIHRITSGATVFQ